MEKKTGLQYIFFINNDPAEPARSLDSITSEFGEFGYEIIIRPEEIRASRAVINELQAAFKKPFGLSDDHYVFEPTFWRVYWDNGFLALKKLDDCERLLDEVACKYNILMRTNGLIVQPRPLTYLQQHVQFNKKQLDLEN